MVSPVFLIGAQLPASLQANVVVLKERVVQACGVQPEAQIVPHLTLNLNHFFDVASVEDSLARLCSLQAPISMKAQRVNIFPRKEAEPAIVHVGIEENPLLQSFQAKVCKEVAPFHERQALVDNDQARGVRLSSRFKSNAHKYGYPYVGSTFTPHITIAFLEPQHFNTLGPELLRENTNETFIVDTVILYEWGNLEQNWVEYKTFKLRGTREYV